MEKFKSIFGRQQSEQNSEETSIVDELWKNSSFSWSTRLKGFITCFVIGCVFAFIAGLFFVMGIGNLATFGALYTLGNIGMIGSTLFLMGPINQFKKMFHSTRIIATIIMLIALVMTLVSALVFHNKGLCLLFIFIQFFALLWYSLSYIPFARDAVKKSS